jgi:site-specific recombinase XerD
MLQITAQLPLRHACGYYLAAQGHDTRAIQDYLGRATRLA